jgi:hypothetical protein
MLPIIVAVVVPVAAVAALGVGVLVYIRRKRRDQTFADMMQPNDLPAHLSASAPVSTPSSSDGGGREDLSPARRGAGRRYDV